MSALYSFVYPDCVQLLTDGAFLDEAGILQRIDSKVIAFPNHPIAITWRAANALHARFVIRDLGDFLDSYGSFIGADAVIMFTRKFFRRLAKSGAFEAEFLIAAFSESIGSCHFIVACHEHWDFPAFELVQPGVQIGGGPPITFSDLVNLKLTAHDMGSSSFPERFGADVIGAMRAKPGRIPGSSKEIFGVGGICELTTVRATGAVTQQLCRWDDEIGKAIDPARGQLSRHNGETR